MRKWARVRIEEKSGEFVGYNVCESIKDAKRYIKIMNKNFKAIIEETGKYDK